MVEVMIVDIALVASKVRSISWVVHFVFVGQPSLGL